MPESPTNVETPAGPRPAALRAVSVVVPVYGDGLALPELLARLEAVFQAQGLAEWEAILVNDGSPGPCWEPLLRARPADARVRRIDLLRNYGQHNAVLCGIRAARLPVVATLDDDLQHPPEALPALLARLHEGYDVVYGTPQRQQHGLLRDAASALTKLALRSVMGVETARQVSALRVFRTELRDAFARYESPFVSIDVLLTWGTKRFASLPVRHDSRRLGSSHYTLRRLITHALDMLTGFSTLPLQLASLVGFAFTAFGMLVLAVVLGRYLVSGSPVAGFPFLASIIALFSGAQLFALGILGEYLARVHLRMLDRPPYVVRRGRGEVRPERPPRAGSGD